MSGRSFRAGDEVVWLKNAGGSFVFPVLAKVVAVTPKRITITAADPDEKGEGVVTRHVHPTKLQPRAKGTTPRLSSRKVSRDSRPLNDVLPDSDTFEARYPHIASWVQDGWIEIGHDDCGRPFLRAMDIGGVVWEGDERYKSMDQALRALDQGIAEWLIENG